jgi:hypothetical protein
MADVLVSALVSLDTLQIFLRTKIVNRITRLYLRLDDIGFVFEIYLPTT